MPETRHTEFQNRMRALALLFTVLGVVSVLAMALLLLPAVTLQGVIAAVLRLSGRVEQPLSPVAVYLLRLFAAMWAGVALMFFVAARDPARHMVFATVTAGTLLFAGLVTLLAGWETRLPIILPIIQALALWIAAALIVRLWPQPPEEK